MDEDMSVVGDLQVFGQIKAGGEQHEITAPDGRIDGAQIEPGTVGSTQLGTGAACESNITGGAVTETKLGDGAVSTVKIADNAVTAAKIANGTVTSDDILDGTISANDLGSNSVTNAKIATAAVTSAKISDSTIVSADIFNGTILAEDLADNAVVEGKILNGAVTVDKIGAGAVDTSKLANGSVGDAKLATSAVTSAKILNAAILAEDLASSSVTPAKLDSSQTYIVGKLGVNTSAVPYNNVGYAKLAVHGAQGTENCPSVQFTTTQDAFPVMCLTPSAHNSGAIRFDCYSEPPVPGSETEFNWQRSSLQSSNAEILKYSDLLSLMYASGKPTDTSFSWTTGFQMSCTTGSITMPAVYGQTVGSPYRALYIDSTGKIGYLSSSIGMKENVRDTAEADTGFIYALRPVMFDYKDPAMGTNQCGLIAEEVDTVCPRIVGYQREVTYVPPADPNDHNDVLTPVVTTTNIPETVNYEKLTVPMLAEMQRLKKRVDELETRVAKLESLEARIAQLEAGK